jgi:FkbH-like protein
LIIDLDWLLPAPADFRDRLKAVRAARAAGEAVEERLHALACHRLDLNQLSQLGRAAREVERPEALAQLRLGLVGAGTLDLLADAIAGSAVRHRVLATVVTGDYGNAVRDCIDADRSLRRLDLDALLIAIDHHMLGLAQPRLSIADAEAAVADALATVAAMVEGAGKVVRGSILVATLVPPVEALFGSYDLVEAGSVAAMVAAVNTGLVAMARAESIMLVDFAGLAAVVGRDHWHDPRQWHLAKLMIGPEALPLAGEAVARVLAAVRGTTRKCLVLDLDNSLWGGVIGDDGVDGIVIGQGSAVGEAFVTVQQLALQLRQRGIILAVCSKNDEDVARAPFREHPDMVLREEHVAVFVANWGDKATNLRAIAAALNIGLDALVLFDDNPAERAQVRRELPMVAVPEIGDDPALYPRLLAGAGYFEAVAFAEDDRVRADAYRANAERAAFAGTSDMATYLQSLDMVAELRGFDGVNRARIAQLINKSNQFNLTTRRYAEPEVAAMAADPALVTLQVRLADRFGDNGMVSVVILRAEGTAMAIDTWLMSCRVLGRRLEEAVLAELVAAARARGADRLIGRYRPTAKNAMVAGHYETLGFVLVTRHDDGGSDWRLDLADWSAPDLPIRIDRG